MITKNNGDGRARTHQVRYSHGQVHKLHLLKLPHPKPSTGAEDGQQLRLLLSITPYITEALCPSPFLIKNSILGPSGKTILLHGLQRQKTAEERYFQYYSPSTLYSFKLLTYAFP